MRDPDRRPASPQRSLTVASGATPRVPCSATPPRPSHRQQQHRLAPGGALSAGPAARRCVVQPPWPRGPSSRRAAGSETASWVGGARWAPATRRVDAVDRQARRRTRRPAATTSSRSRRGREDYYAGEGEAPGVGSARARPALGLCGRGHRGRHRAAARRALHPASGALLRQPLASGAVAGFDLTFRAPKSVSVLFGIGDAGSSRQVRAAHEARGRRGARLPRARGVSARGAATAARIAVDGRRVRRGGVPAPHLARRRSAAAHPRRRRQRDARARRALDGARRPAALPARQDRRLPLPSGAARGAHRAAGRAVVARSRTGRPTSRAFPRGVIEHFSRRRAEILRVHARARRALGTRRAGRDARDAAAQGLRRRRRRLRERLARARRRARPGRRVASGGCTCGRAAAGRRAATSELRPAAGGPDGLTRDRSTFTRRDVAAGVRRARRGPARPSRARGPAPTRSSRASRVVALERRRRAPLHDPRAARRSSATLLDAARGRRRDGRRRRRRRPALDAALDARPTLSDGAASRSSIALARGRDGRRRSSERRAGTGKTFALDAAREAWQRSGIAVLGCALSARAACELRDQAGDRRDHDRAADATRLDRGVELAPGSVLIVDEAGMVGTRDLAALADAAERREREARARRRRPPAARDRGRRRVPRARRARSARVELREVRRQREAWDRDALAALRDGRRRAVRRRLPRARPARRGARPPSTPATRARRRLVAGAPRAATETLMIAHRRARRRRPQPARPRARCARPDASAPTSSHVDERAFAVGDRVIATPQRPRLGVVNGHAGTLTERSPTDVCASRSTARRRRSSCREPTSSTATSTTATRSPPTAPRARPSTAPSSSAPTSSTASGATPRCRATATRPRFYVSATPDTLNRPPSPLQGDQDAAREAMRMLATSRAQQLALDGVEPHLRRAIDPLAALGARQIDPARERPPRPELELGRDVGADIGIGH